MRHVLMVAAAVAAVFACSAAAQTSAAVARAQGMVGERFDGYLGYARVPSSNHVRSQTEAINIRRRKLYTDLAASRGVSPQEVGVTAGCTLLGRVAVGEAYMLSDGLWRRRGAGQRAPVPDYCTGD
ncbi:YdbL family protein [Sphingomonas sp. GCM10030256]|uniref:YdbL family protein n=1 Tax=Sphingomonas sp. GCM10030256 TaxID=3273427 RepID=UPI003619019D